MYINKTRSVGLSTFAIAPFLASLGLMGRPFDLASMPPLIPASGGAHGPAPRWIRPFKGKRRRGSVARDRRKAAKRRAVKRARKLGHTRRKAG